MTRFIFVLVLMASLLSASAATYFDSLTAGSTASGAVTVNGGGVTNHFNDFGTNDVNHAWRLLGTNGHYIFVDQYLTTNVFFTNYWAIFWTNGNSFAITNGNAYANGVLLGASGGASLGIVTNGGSGKNNQFTNMLSVAQTNYSPITLEDNVGANAVLVTNLSGAIYFTTASGGFVDVLGGGFWGNGVHLTSLPAGQLTGSIADARLSANVSLLGQTISEGELALTDVTTANASTSGHGFAPKLPNDATKFWDGTGVFSTPAGGTVSPTTLTQTNFVLNTVYTNGSQTALLKASVSLTTANVSGQSSMQLMADQAGGTTFVMVSSNGITTSLGVSIADTDTRTMAALVAANATYYWSNSSFGLNDTSAIVPGSGQISTISSGTNGNTGATGATGAQGPAGSGTSESILYHGRLSFATVQAFPGANAIFDMNGAAPASTTAQAFYPPVAITITRLYCSWSTTAQNGTNQCLGVWTNDIFMCGITNKLNTNPANTNSAFTGMIIPAGVKTYIEMGVATNGVASQTVGNAICNWIVYSSQ